LAVGSYNPDPPVAVKAYLGTDLEDSGDFVSLRSVRAGSPAYEQGLNAKDQIVALDGVRVNRELFELLVAGKKPGEVIHITLFRDDNLRTLDIKLGGNIAAAYRIVQLPSLGDQQKRIYESWLQVQNRLR
jgi:predicted metalloprotease with PDZ domain